MKRVLMLLTNGVEPLEIAGFTDVLGWADLVGEPPVKLDHVGLRPEILTTFGLTLKMPRLLEEVNLADYDALALPGGTEPAGFYHEALSVPFLDVIRYFAAAGKPIASVCVSSIALGVAGVLTGKNATIYHQVGGVRKQQLIETGAIFVDRPIVVDGNLITSSGPGTASEVAFALLEKLTGVANATSVRKKMRFDLPSKKWYETAQV